MWTARLLLAALLIAVASCGGVRVRRVESQPIVASWRDSALTEGKLSPRTGQVLRQFHLNGLFPGKPDQLQRELHARATAEPTPGLLFTLAELNHLRGEAAFARGAAESAALYQRAAGYAYHYLFREDRSAGADYDPQFRLACDLYNASLTRLLAGWHRDGTFALDTTGLPLTFTGFDYRPDEFGPARLCSEYQVIGLTNHHRTYGLGVPLIGSRDPRAATPNHGFHPSLANFPLTAFLHFDGGLDDIEKRGRLELINPLTRQAVSVRDRAVPLETDLTTPLAFFLARAKLDAAGLIGFLRPDSLGDRAGLHALQPYQPGKVPLVFVHGLLSSPGTWAPMYNDLLADPVIRQRYQFWVYFYPTGDPYLATAAQLRTELAALRRRLDPQDSDPALSEMVFVGHSMGGLVSRLLTVEGGDDFWRLVSPQPLDRLSLHPGSREALRNTFYFERQPHVTRVIYLGTPHRGSRLSPSFAGRLAARLAGVPTRVMTTLRDLTEDNPGILQGPLATTSVDLLAPGAPALQLIAHRARPKAVTYHSIIGVSDRGDLLLERLLGGGYRRPSDGVVPYESAHLDDVASELVVPADHYRVHQHPLAVLEVRRILLEHLRQVAPRLQPIQPVGG